MWQSSFKKPIPRFGCIVDTGAVDTLVGSGWCDCFIDMVLKPMGLDRLLVQTEADSSYRGIGSGTTKSNVRARIPTWQEGAAWLEGAVVEEAHDATSHLPCLL